MGDTEMALQMQPPPRARGEAGLSGLRDALPGIVLLEGQERASFGSGWGKKKLKLQRPCWQTLSGSGWQRRGVEYRADKDRVGSPQAAA